MAAKRRAASVFLTRGRGPDVEVYLVERSKRLRFFGGYFACPGGVVGDEDTVYDGERALRACAVRELFEETGVLLSPLSTRVEDDERDSLREAMTRRDPDLERWSHVLERAPSVLDGLESLGMLTTPEFAPVRYETAFYHAELPGREWPTIVRGELVDGAFYKPDEAIRAWLEGDILIVPPVLTLLRILDAAGPVDFYAEVEREFRALGAGKLHPVFFTPGVLLAALATPTLPPATTTNCYLVGHREIWIVDPATPEPSEQQRLFDLIDEWREQGRELGGILSTHHHEDHVGALAATSQRYQLPVYGHPLTLERLPPGIEEKRAIDDGDRIDLGRAPDGAEDWHLQVLHTPGHDRGHLAFFESRYGTAIVGDLCSTVSTIVIDPPEGHLATYLASLRRLLELPITSLYPAHGPAHRDGHALVRQYLAHRDDRECALLAALGPEPRTVEDLVPDVYTEEDPEVYPVAARSLLAGLLKLEEEGRARPDGEGWCEAAGP